MDLNIKKKWIKSTPITSEIRLYKEGEVPSDLKGRGVWGMYGEERLFCPFGGNGTHLVDSDWQCKNCGRKWYYNDLVKNCNSHCPTCGLWIGLKGLKFNGKQKNLEEFNIK